MIGILKDAVSLTYYTGLRLFNNNHHRELALVYHSLGNLSRINDPYKMNVSVSLFQQQVDFLVCSNQQNITLTFDDGFANFFAVALPLILKYNIKSILFVAVGFIDGKITYDNFFAKQVKIQPLTWEQIKKIASFGIEIGSHTLTHPNLAKLDCKTVGLEIRDSKKRIEDIIGKKVRYFAYPYGAKNSFNKQIKLIVRECGYEKAYTNIMGFNHPDTDRFELKRMRIYSDDNLFRFRLKINGAYNWVDKC